jgi:hypothetical protein
MPGAMKRVFKILFLLLLTVSVTVSLAFGQEKKTERKVKVVVDDGSGAETVLDTTITGSTMPEIITLKNGKVIFIGEPGEKDKSDTRTEKVYVTVTKSDEGDKENEEKIVVITGNDAKWTASSKSAHKSDIYLESDDNSDTGSTKFIIAKDGMVVTVEGKDEVKVEKMRKEIETILDVRNDEDPGKESVKTITKKPVKK